MPPHGVDELPHPKPGYYAIGAKSYGRAPTFLLATGYEQARSVVASLAVDWESARNVRLELSETSVCSSNLAPGDTAQFLVLRLASRYVPRCRAGSGRSVGSVCLGQLQLQLQLHRRWRQGVS